MMGLYSEDECNEGVKLRMNVMMGLNSEDECNDEVILGVECNDSHADSFERAHHSGLVKG